MCDRRYPYPRITMKAEAAKAREAEKVEREMENEEEKGAEMISKTPDCHSDAALDDLSNRLSGATWGGGPKGMRSLCMRALMAISYLRAEIKRLRGELDAIATPHTLVQCDGCDRGIRSRYAVAGMCPDCAEREIMERRAELGHCRSQWTAALVTNLQAGGKGYEEATAEAEARVANACRVFRGLTK